MRLNILGSVRRRRRRQATEQRERVEVDGDGAVAERPLKHDAYVAHSAWHCTVVAQAGLATHPSDIAQYFPLGHAVAPVVGPIVWAHLPELHESIVHANPSSQVPGAQTTLPPVPPTAASE